MSDQEYNELLKVGREVYEATRDKLHIAPPHRSCQDCAVLRELYRALGSLAFLDRLVGQGVIGRLDKQKDS